MAQRLPAIFDLTPAELDRLRALCDRAVANISRGLTEMFGAEMHVTALDLCVMPLAAAGGLLGDPEREIVGVYLATEGALSARLLLALAWPVALQLCDILLEQPLGCTRIIGELEASALGEMGNIAGSFFLNALSDSTGTPLMLTPPTLLHDMAGTAIAAALLDVAAVADEALIIDAGFEHAGMHLPAWFLTFPRPGQLRGLLRLAEGAAP